MSAAAAPAPPAGIDELRALTRDLLAHDAWPRERLARPPARTPAGDPAPRRQPPRRTTARSSARTPRRPDVDLASLPILRKETLVERFDDIVTDPRLRLADLEAHLAGPDAEQPYLGAYRAFSTSGTSGLRALVVYDRDDMATGIASSLRAVARQGVGPATRLVAIGSPDPLHLTRQLFAAFRAGRAGRAGADRRHTARRDGAARSTPTSPRRSRAIRRSAALLADEQLEGRLHIAPRILAFGSEPTTADILARLDAAWGVRPGERLRHDGGADRRGRARRRTPPSTSPRTSSCSRSSTPPASGPRRRRRRPDPRDEPREPDAAAHPLRDRRRRDGRARPRARPGAPTAASPPSRGAAATSSSCPASEAARSPSTRSGSGGRWPRSPTCASSSSAATAPRSSWRSSCARARRATCPAGCGPRSCASSRRRARSRRPSRSRRSPRSRARPARARSSSSSARRADAAGRRRPARQRTMRTVPASPSTSTVAVPDRAVAFRRRRRPGSRTRGRRPPSG